MDDKTYQAIVKKERRRHLAQFVRNRMWDRPDCVHYNATYTDERKHGRTWRDGCLYQAAKEDRPTVCKRGCPVYERQPLEPNGHICSSAGTIQDQEGAGV